MQCMFKNKICDIYQIDAIIVKNIKFCFNIQVIYMHISFTCSAQFDVFVVNILLLRASIICVYFYFNIHTGFIVLNLFVGLLDIFTLKEKCQHIACRFLQIILKMNIDKNICRLLF